MSTTTRLTRADDTEADELARLAVAMRRIVRVRCSVCRAAPGAHCADDPGAVPRSHLTETRVHSERVIDALLLDEVEQQRRAVEASRMHAASQPRRRP